MQYDAPCIRLFWHIPEEGLVEIEGTHENFVTGTIGEALAKGWESDLADAPIRRFDILA